MFLDYLSLVILLMGLTLVFYVFIYIHDLPHKIAKEREHPHEEAIHVACWLSLFTLHAMWPIVYTWSVMHKKPKPESGGLLIPGEAESPQDRRFTDLEERLRKLESAK
jgi:hypothetical protein